MLSFNDILNDISDEIDRELSWRKKELNSLKEELDNFSKNREEEEFSFFKRGSIALTYAHLEGGAKNLFIVYLKFLNRLFDNEILSIKRKNIDEIIIDLIFYKKVKIFNQNSREKRIKGLKSCQEFFDGSSRIKIETDIINTKSNLNFKVLKEIYELLGIDMNQDIELNSKFINQLVKRRNGIAHGENISDNKKIVVESIEKALFIIDLIRNDVEKAMKKFKSKELLCN